MPTEPCNHRVFALKKPLQAGFDRFFGPHQPENFANVKPGHYALPWDADAPVPYGRCVFWTPLWHYLPTRAGGGAESDGVYEVAITLV